MAKILILLFCGLFVIFKTYGQNICFTQEQFEEAFKSAFNRYEELEDILLNDIDLNANGTTLDPNDPIFNHFKSAEVSWNILSSDKFAVVTNIVLKELIKDKSYTREEFIGCLKKIVTLKFCTPINVNCDFNATNYYRFDGQCNSKTNPLFGSVGTPMERFVPPPFMNHALLKIYANHSSRSESEIGNQQKGNFNPLREPLINNDFSLLEWQIFTHETMKTFKIQHTPHEGDPGVNCCSKTGNKTLENLINKNPNCRPIDVHKNDTCYNGTINCMHYSRSLEAFPQCNISMPSAPINNHDPYLNLELIFNPKGMNHLFSNGGLFALNNNTIMKNILVGYDERSMQLPGLFLYLNFYAKFYNQMFNEIRTLKPALAIYQTIFEARKITTAVYQKLTVDLVKSVFQYEPKCSYSPDINPQVTIEYNIALRFFHYFIRDHWAFYEASLFQNKNGLKGAKIKETTLFEILDNLDLALNNKCGLAHGLLDSSWNIGATGPMNHCNFFAKNDKHHGIDLRSYDYEFARSVNEPTYCEVLKFLEMFQGNCDDNLRVEDLREFIDEEILIKLKEKYGSLANIGLTMGLDVEHRADAIGHTTEKLIAKQMDRFICGDRFWYNHPNGILSDTQRSIINDFTAFAFLCNVHSCNSTRLQGDCRFSPGFGNGKILCNFEFDSFDIKRWVAKL